MTSYDGLEQDESRSIVIAGYAGRDFALLPSIP